MMMSFIDFGWREYYFDFRHYSPRTNGRTIHRLRRVFFFATPLAALAGAAGAGFALIYTHYWLLTKIR